MWETIKNAWKIKEIRIKILITLGLVLLFRLGSFIPVAGINPLKFGEAFSGADAGFMGIMNSVVGGALGKGTIFAMGIAPYINASIIMQLLTVGIKKLEEMQKSGEEGRKKIAAITRFVTIVLAVVQAVGILLSYNSANLIDKSIFSNIGMGDGMTWLLYIIIVVQFAAGTALVMWLGERITELGIGNGMSLLIFAGIIATAANSLFTSVTTIATGTGDAASTALFDVLMFLAIMIIIFGLIVWVDLAERRIPVQYAKQVKGRKMYGGQSSVIPIRINASGVLPLIFAFALISFPSLISGMFNLTDMNRTGGNPQFWIGLLNLLGPGKWLYVVLVSLLILFFSYFYAMIQFNPDDISRNIQQYGGFIPGIRPGKPTTDYLRKIANRITLFGAIFLALIALVPSFVLSLVISDGSRLLNALSTTGMLIVVNVALEFNKQLESQIMMRHYKGFLN